MAPVALFKPGHRTLLHVDVDSLAELMAEAHIRLRIPRFRQVFRVNNTVLSVDAADESR